MSLTAASLDSPLHRPAALTPRTATTFFCAAILAAALAGALSTPPAQTARAVAMAGPDWANLLRAMAGLKTVMAGGAVAGVLWRLRAPATIGCVVGYAAAGASMLAGPGLVWGLAHIALGALLLHAGLAATVVLLWRDPVVAARLAGLVAARRARLG